MVSFKDTWILIFIPLIVLVFFVFLRKRVNHPSFLFPSKKLFLQIKENGKIFVERNLIYLRLFILCLFIVALAGPQEILEKTEITTEGIDIILTVDASGSMAAEDFQKDNKRVNRLEIVKEVVSEFIRGRKSDRMGLVVFAAQAYTACPLTTDYDWLIANLKRIELGIIQEDGTAIGSALATSLNRLKESQAKSKIIILLTDGVNNVGKILPLEAADAARALGVKIYTIGAGTTGFAPFPVQDFFGRKAYQQIAVEIDEKVLKEIAQKTEGLYFRAMDTESLRAIYKEIDRLEKTKIEETGYKEYKQLFVYVLLAALMLLLIEIILKNTILMRIP
ncbi:MAG TPA: VWA domain-containing protein [Candidatus Omnitrophota bacterium]|nr:VWA domain-containing protein [Candidatus Omnitrophota bacterium]